MRWLGAAALFLAVLLILTFDAWSHSAPSGMPYPTNCCHQSECGPVPSATIRETLAGYEVIVQPGQHHNVKTQTAVKLFRYNDPRVRNSTDGEFHACIGEEYPNSAKASNAGVIHCIIVPPQSF